MKMKILVAISILAAALQFAPVTLGTEPAASGKRWRQYEGRFGNLPANEREKLRAAFEKALNDPAVLAAKEKMRQARRELRDAMHAAMLRDDPSIQPILDKMPRGWKDRD